MDTYDDDDTFDDADFYGPAPDKVIDTEVTDEAPADGGQGDVTDSAPEQGAPPQTDYFDPNAFANHKVKVKVDGEELEVPVPELVQGYQRQADYTRKTQALAEERQQIAFWQDVDRAMRANPAATLEYLQRTYGYTPQQVNAGLGAAQDETWGDDNDPIRKELVELKQTLGSVNQFIAQQQAERELRQTVEGLTAKYGDDFKPQEVISEALRRGIDNPAQLELVYQSMAYDRLRAAAAAATQFQTNTAQEAAQRQAAAAAAAQVISAGTGATGRGAPPSKATPSNISVRDAIALALAEASA